MNKILISIITLLFCNQVLAKITLNLITSVSPKGDRHIVEKGVPKSEFLELGYNALSFEIIEEGEYRIWQQTETSVTVMNEGPHLDLMDWKHGFSNWEALKKDGSKHLIIEQENIVFPKVSMNDLVNEAERAGDKIMKDIAKKCKSVDDYPCGIAPSRKKFKIEKRSGDKWEYMGSFDLMLPMGC